MGDFAASMEALKSDAAEIRRMFAPFQAESEAFRDQGKALRNTLKHHRLLLEDVIRSTCSPASSRSLSTESSEIGCSVCGKSERESFPKTSWSEESNTRRCPTCISAPLDSQAQTSSAEKVHVGGVGGSDGTMADNTLEDGAAEDDSLQDSVALRGSLAAEQETPFPRPPESTAHEASWTTTPFSLQPYHNQEPLTCSKALAAKFEALSPSESSEANTTVEMAAEIQVRQLPAAHEGEAERVHQEQDEVQEVAEVCQRGISGAAGAAPCLDTGHDNTEGAKQETITQGHLSERGSEAEQKSSDVHVQDRRKQLDPDAFTHAEQHDPRADTKASSETLVCKGNQSSAPMLGGQGLEGETLGQVEQAQRDEASATAAMMSRIVSLARDEDDTDACYAGACNADDADTCRTGMLATRPALLVVSSARDADDADACNAGISMPFQSENIQPHKQHACNAGISTVQRRHQHSAEENSEAECNAGISTAQRSTCASARVQRRNGRLISRAAVADDQDASRTVGRAVEGQSEGGGEKACVRLEEEQEQEQEEEQQVMQQQQNGKSAVELGKLSQQVGVKIRERASPENLASLRAAEPEPTEGKVAGVAGRVEGGVADVGRAEGSVADVAGRVEQELREPAAEARGEAIEELCVLTSSSPSDQGCNGPARTEQELWSWVSCPSPVQPAERERMRQSPDTDTDTHHKSPLSLSIDTVSRPRSLSVDSLPSHAGSHAGIDRPTRARSPSLLPSPPPPPLLHPMLCYVAHVPSGANAASRPCDEHEREVEQPHQRAPLGSRTRQDAQESSEKEEEEKGWLVETVPSPEHLPAATSPPEQLAARADPGARKDSCPVASFGSPAEAKSQNTEQLADWCWTDACTPVWVSRVSKTVYSLEETLLELQVQVPEELQKRDKVIREMKGDLMEQLLGMSATVRELAADKDEAEASLHEALALCEEQDHELVGLRGMLHGKRAASVSAEELECMHTCISALEATSFDMQVTLSAAQCEATPSRAGAAANALLAEERYARSKLQAQLDAALLEAAAKEAHVAAARAEARGLQARCEKMEIEARREAVSSCSRIGTLTCKIVELEQQLSSMSEELRNAHARTASTDVTYNTPAPPPPLRPHESAHVEHARCVAQDAQALPSEHANPVWGQRTGETGTGMYAVQAAHAPSEQGLGGGANGTAARAGAHGEQEALLRRGKSQGIESLKVMKAGLCLSSSEASGCAAEQESDEVHERMELFKGEGLVQVVSTPQVLDGKNARNALGVEERGERGERDGKGGKWQRALDPASGDVYYYHTVTLQTCWDRPLSYPSTPEPEDAGEFVECRSCLRPMKPAWQRCAICKTPNASEHHDLPLRSPPLWLPTANGGWKLTHGGHSSAKLGGAVNTARTAHSGTSTPASAKALKASRSVDPESSAAVMLELRGKLKERREARGQIDEEVVGYGRAGAKTGLGRESEVANAGDAHGPQRHRDLRDSRDETRDVCSLSTCEQSGDKHVSTCETEKAAGGKGLGLWASSPRESDDAGDAGGEKSCDSSIQPIRHEDAVAPRVRRDIKAAKENKETERRRRREGMGREKQGEEEREQAGRRGEVGRMRRIEKEERREDKGKTKRKKANKGTEEAVAPVAPGEDDDCRATPSRHACMSSLQGPNLTSLDAMPDEDLRHHVSDDTFGHSFSETFHNAEDDWFDAGEDQTSHPPHSEDPRRGNDGMESIDMVDEIFAKVDASGGGALALLDAWASA